MSALARLRRFWLDVHLWLGAVLFIPLAVLGVTGTVLTFHDELDRLVAPKRYELSAGTTAPMQSWLEAARGVLGADFVVTGVRPPESADAPALVQARARAKPPEGQRPDSRTVFVDPVSGRVLDLANTRADAFGIMHQLHGTLMIPENGRKIVGWLGWAMLVSSLTGLWLWWPRGGSVLRGLAWKRSPRTTSNLHHLTGFWIALPLAALSFTGAYISFPQFSRSMLGAFVALPHDAPRNPGGGPGGGALPIDAPHLSADAAAAAALLAAPDARLIAVNLPTEARGDEAPNWRVQVKTRAAEANVTINVADDSGVAEAPDAPAADQNTARLMRRIHDGTDLGIVWRVIIALAGLAPALLGVTGIVMWLRRRAARRAFRRGHPSKAKWPAIS